MNLETIFLVSGSLFFVVGTVAGIAVVMLSIVVYKKLTSLSETFDSTAQKAQEMMRQFQSQPVPTIMQLIAPFIAKLPFARFLLKKR